MATTELAGPSSAPRTLRIDFVSDITCPWCAIGLPALEQAIERLGDAVPVELHLQPFELNPDIPPEGEPIADYAWRKRGATPEQMAERQAFIRRHGAEAGITLAARTHVYNTFDAHRLLHWAGLEGRQRELKHVLLTAYHRHGENPARHEVLLGSAAKAGLDIARARDLLESGAHAEAVRNTVRHWQRMGITSVPSIVCNGRWQLPGGASADVLEQSLRQIAADLAKEH